MKISTTVCKIIADTIGIDSKDIHLSDKMKEDLQMDSIDIDEVLMELSYIFDLDIGAFYDQSKHKTVRSICKIIKDYK